MKNKLTPHSTLADSGAAVDAFMLTLDQGGQDLAAKKAAFVRIIRSWIGYV